jgi:hypothetical protein
VSGCRVLPEYLRSRSPVMISLHLTLLDSATR